MQRIDFELSVAVPSEWIEFLRIRSVFIAGRPLLPFLEPQIAVTGFVAHLAKCLADECRSTAPPQPVLSGSQPGLQRRCELCIRNPAHVTRGGNGMLIF